MNVLTTLEKTKKSNFICSEFGILLVCCLRRVYLHKNIRNICVAICFGFTKKIFSLPKLIDASQKIGFDWPSGFRDEDV